MIWLVSFVLAVGLISSGFMVIIQKNPIHSALFLIITFLFLAGFYLLLGAEFIAFVHIIVYAGAVMVLFLFVIMLLNLRHDVQSFVLSRQQMVVAILLGIIAFGLIVTILLPARYYPLHEALGTTQGELEFRQDNIQKVGLLLFSKYLVPFEIASILLLVAMIGAVVLAKKDLL